MGGCYIEDNVSKLKSKMNDNKVIILVYALGAVIVMK